jgi:hypothetical protein
LCLGLLLLLELVLLLPLDLFFELVVSLLAHLFLLFLQLLDFKRTGYLVLLSFVLRLIFVLGCAYWKIGAWVATIHGLKELL